MVDRDVTPAPRPLRLGPAAVTYTPVTSILTPATGFVGAYDFTLNPFAGCTFACEYCYARFFAPEDALIATWGNWVRVKEGAIGALRRARRSRGKHRLMPGARIYMSSVTDRYQPIERQLGLTREILAELVEMQPRLTIQTRSPIATRDIDLFRRFQRIRVNFTVTTDSERVRLRYEPRCPSIASRLRAAARVADVGVPIGISISPMLPFEDAREFAQRIARLRAAEYVTQYLKPSSARFSAGSPLEAAEKLREDGWSLRRYADGRDTIGETLRTYGLTLLEGTDMPPLNSIEWQNTL